MIRHLKRLAGLSLVFGTFLSCLAQDLTVHVVTDSSRPKSVSGIAVQLFPEPAMPGRRKVISEKSDSDGVVVFHNIDLSSIAWSVSIFNLGTTATDPVVILCKPENATAQQVRPTISALPAEITIHIRKRGFGEQMEYIFRGP